MTDFTTFNIAKKLKEKGFREECFAYYTSEYTLYNNLVVLCDDKYLEVAEIDYTESLTSNNSVRENKYNNICDAPTISQVLKWLRENKNIHICIDIYDDGWFFDVASFYKEDTGVYEIKLPYKSSKVTPDYDSFEQAALAGIEYVLNNLI